jgi:hypothetical protein
MDLHEYQGKQLPNVHTQATMLGAEEMVVEPAGSGPS